MGERKSLNKKSLTKYIAKIANISQRKAGIVLNTVLSVIKEDIVDNKKSSIPQIGSFIIKERKSRRYRNIRTGEIQNSIPRLSVVFRASSLLSNILNDLGKAKDNRSSEKKRKFYIEDGSGCKVYYSKPNPEQTADLRIKFVPILSLVNEQNFPIVLMPQTNSLLKLPREGRSDVRGYKEKDFLNELQKSNLPISISVDKHLSILGRTLPYEPDFVLYDKELNLYIDIEIDEPYDGFSRTPTHVSNGTDKIRDKFFIDSGWVVLRFTEHQIHTNSRGCIATISYIVDSLRQNLGSMNLPNYIVHEDKWNSIQAIIWERNLYREKYLGIQSFEKIVRNFKVICIDKSDKIEPYLSRPEIHESLAKYQTNTNKEKDINSQIKFDEKNHIYYPKKDPSGNSDYISVTTLIEEFFPYFDVDAYIKKQMEVTGKRKEEIEKELTEPSERGTAMHAEIEKCLKGESFDSSSKELQMFKRFYDDCIIPQNLSFFAAEKVIELPEHNIAGTVDALFKKPNGDYVMIDWKRSKHLIIDGYPRKYGFGRGLSVLSHLDNSSYYKYEMQQSFYKYILEKRYKMRISSMILVVLYPTYDNYFTIKLSKYREKEVKEIIEIHDRMLK
jgi:nucleoid DNA-binding protein